MREISSGADSQAAAVDAMAAAFSSAEVFPDRPEWKGAFWERRERERSERVAARAERRAGGAAPAALNLGKATLDPQAPFRPGYVGESDAWQVKVTRYSSGYVEASAFTGFCAMRPKAESSKAASSLRRGRQFSSESSAQAAERFESSVARSRALCRRRVLALAADSMLTLTRRGKFASAADAWAAFRLFSQSMKRRFGVRWRYVAVPELHADGETWHLHVAVKGFFWIGTLRRFWYRALGGAGDESGADTPGSIHVKFFKPRSGVTAAGSVAGYVAKYVGKGLCGLARNGRVFAASAGLHPDSIEKWHALELWGFQDAAVAVQRFLLRSGCDAKGAVWFFSKGRLAGFRLSTVRSGKNVEG